MRYDAPFPRTSAELGRVCKDMLFEDSEVKEAFDKFNRHERVHLHDVSDVFGHVAYVAHFQWMPDTWLGFYSDLDAAFEFLRHWNDREPAWAVQFGVFDNCPRIEVIHDPA